MRIKRYTFEDMEQFRKNIRDNPKYDWKTGIREFCSDPANIVFFAYLFLGRRQGQEWGIIDREFAPVHYEALEFLQIGVAQDGNKASKQPRSFGKSTIGVVLATVYEACYSTYKYILLNSYSTDSSKRMLQSVKHVFEQSDLIKWVFGDPVNNFDHWKQESIVVFDKTYVDIASTSQNVRGRSWRGTRPQKIVSDDILDSQDVLSPDNREKTRNWYVNDLMPTLPPSSQYKGTMWLINTPMHPDDLIEDIFAEKPNFPKEEWKKLHIPALVDGKSIDENWITTDRLLFMQQQRPVQFAQEYLGTPINSKGGFIDEEDVMWYNHLPPMDQFVGAFMHADTTGTAKTTSDYFACGIFGKTKDNKAYLLDCIVDKKNPEEQARIVINLYTKWKDLVKINWMRYDAVANESFGWFARELARQQGVYLPLQPTKYPRDKIQHFDPHIPKFKSKSVYFPITHKYISTVKQQLLAFPQKGVNDDAVDMISGCLDGFNTPEKMERNKQALEAILH